MLLGTAIVKKDKAGSLYVEYHQCDKCNAEYRLYFRAEKMDEEAFQEMAKRLGNKVNEKDLCFNCQNQVIGDQVMLPLEV